MVEKKKSCKDEGLEEKINNRISRDKKMASLCWLLTAVAIFAMLITMIAFQGNAFAVVWFVLTVVFWLLAGAFSKSAKKQVDGALGEFFRQERERLFGPLNGTDCVTIDANSSKLMEGIIAWNEIPVSDQLKGVRERTPFAAANVRFEEVSEDTDSDGDDSRLVFVHFSGIWLAFRLGRELSSPVYVRKRVTRLHSRKVRSMPEDLQMKDAKFDAKFAVEGSSPEQVRSLLTPKLREALCRLDERAGANTFVEFTGSTMNVVLETERKFCDKGERAKDLEEIRGIYTESLEYVADLVDIVRESGVL